MIYNLYLEKLMPPLSSGINFSKYALWIIYNIPEKMYTSISQSYLSFLIVQFWEVTICRDDHHLCSPVPLISIKIKAYVWQRATL